MTGIIRAPRAHTHDQLPRAALRDSRLSYRARGILARLLTNADGFSMTAHDLAAEGREGRGAILAALKELRAAGYLRTTRRQGPQGRWLTETFVFERPQDTEVQKSNSGSASTEVGKPDSGSPNPGAPDSGSPDSGFPDPKSRGKSSKRKSSSKADAAVPAAAPAGKEQEPAKPSAPALEAPPPAKHTGRKRKRTHPETGVTYWYDDEVAEIEALVKAHGSDAVSAVAADLRGGGTDPLPSVVGAGLLAHARAHEAAQRANNPKRHERTPEERAEDRRKADEAMAEYRRLLKEGS